tara:strand:+ start:946 stop:2109 length:1164 start_codon:yes stop_codon:yes gene_type:complete
MSEEILEGQESEEQSVEETEESSDVQIQAEAKTKASVKKEEEDSEEEEDEEEEVEEAVKEEDEEEGDSEEEEEEPAEESFEIPKTKNQMLKNIYDQVNKMKKSDLSGKYESILKAAQKVVKEEEEVKEEAETTKIQAVSPQEIDPPNVQDDVEALVSGEEGLSEEFKKKASTIFEAAVHAKVVDEVNKRMEEQAKEVDASKDEFQKELTEKVDGYLTYVVEEWMKENELAIERGIRSELVEDFMSGLKTLFTEHYIDLPEEKVDMVDDLFTKVEELETSLDEEINRGVELQKELAQFKKDDAVKEATKDLADADSEKIAKLAEGIEFENTEQYVEKLNVLKESYFPKSEAVTSEITETDENIEVPEEKQELDESMQHYTSAIRRYNS